MKIYSESISITKAFGILLMVMCHAGCPKFMHDFIYIFHMPLFFIMSGYCFKEKYLNTPKQFAIRRVKGLYVPFVKYGLLFLVFHNVLFYLNIYNGEYGFNGNVSSLYSVSDYFHHAILIVTAMSDSEQLLGGYWFLRCLFWGSLISLATIKYVKKPIVGGGNFAYPYNFNKCISNNTCAIFRN
ncbi:MAG: acyltransferase family protein [Prevotella sp.]|nr:acyltransferase family protein [Prevotella sp.]